jgi:hypothetical protein
MTDEPLQYRDLKKPFSGHKRRFPRYYRTDCRGVEITDVIGSYQHSALFWDIFCPDDFQASIDANDTAK